MRLLSVCEGASIIQLMFCQVGVGCRAIAECEASPLITGLPLALQ